MALRTLLPILATLACPVSSQDAFVNFESPLVHPLRLSEDGSRLFGVSTPDNRLIVWSLADPARPVLLAEIPVGLDPVSVTPRNSDEVWVANLVSDTVSVVSLSAGRVIATLQTGAEPSDIVFAGGLAFVSAGLSDEVQVFDATTHAPIQTIPLLAKEPRALAVSPDGFTVYALTRRSGNGTTVLSIPDAPPPPAPTNPLLPPAPQVGRIVSVDHPDIHYTLPDNDIIEIDVTTLQVTGSHTGVGTSLQDLVVHPAAGILFVSNTEARNHVPFEPELRGHAIDSRVSMVHTGPESSVTFFELNPGVDYATLPNAAAKATALAEPTGLALDATKGWLYVAAQGTDRIGVVRGSNGTVLDRIEVGGTPGAAVDTPSKRGPRGLALSSDGDWLYVWNRLSQTVSVVDTVARVVTVEIPLGTHDPTPAEISLGRRFNYDAKLSGNGLMSCSSCHDDGDTDGLAWNLGDPGGELESPPTENNPFAQDLVPFHPMKGPMVTQTFKGLAGAGPLHWRGDKENFQAFNGAFDSLLGGSELSPADMDRFAQWGMSIAFAPNPNLGLDRQLANEPEVSETVGFDIFMNFVLDAMVPPFNTCVACHTLPTGTSTLIFPPSENQNQDMKIPSLRDVYRKQGLIAEPGVESKSGFGLAHNGSVGDLEKGLLGSPGLQSLDPELGDDLLAYLLALDTGMAPMVGHQVDLHAGTLASEGVLSELPTMIERAKLGDGELVAKGELNGELHGLWFDPVAEVFVPDTTALGNYTLGELLTLAQGGSASLVLSGVPPGSGTRIGIDRDLDGVLDADEGVLAYGAATPGCAAPATISANSEPDIGNEEFALILSEGPADASVFLAAGLGQTSISILGATLLVDLSAPGLLVPTSTDATGTAHVSVPLQDNPGLIGLSIYTQYLWADPSCPAALVAATGGLAISVQP